MIAKKCIVFLGKNRMVGALVDPGGKKVLESLELGWDEKTLDLSLAKIIEKFKSKKIRILLDDLYSYVLRIKVPVVFNENEERKYVSDRITEKIPELLADNDWDYKDINFNISSEKKQQSEEKEVLVFSPVKYIFEIISAAVVKMEVEVEAVEPVEISLTRDTNPIIGLALKEDVSGRDKDVLNINVRPKNEDDFKDIIKNGSGQDLSVDGNAAKDTNNSQPGAKKRTNVLLIIFLSVLFISISVGLFYFAVFKKQGGQVGFNKEDSYIEPTAVPSVEPTPQEDANFSTYKIEVLNGTGIAGEAQNAAELLEGAGFSDITTSNALSYDYKKTVVEVKDAVPEKAIEELINALSQDYNVATASSTLKESTYDIRITTGIRLD